MISKEQHKAYIERFQTERPKYEELAKIFNEILSRFVASKKIDAIVQSRVKKISSFAEKILRKGYQDPFVQMTDLCGFRIIVSSKTELEIVSEFIKAHIWYDKIKSVDVRERLRTNEFGYLSIHFDVKTVTDEILGVKIPKELIGLNAEIQVRTILQHAWAVACHDRIYKTPIKVPEEWKRESARIAALLENCENDFNTMSQELDFLAGNFNKLYDLHELKHQIGINQMLLSNAAEGEKKKYDIELAELYFQLGEHSQSLIILQKYFQMDWIRSFIVVERLGNNQPDENTELNFDIKPVPIVDLIKAVKASKTELSINDAQVLLLLGALKFEYASSSENITLSQLFCSIAAFSAYQENDSKASLYIIKALKVLANSLLKTETGAHEIISDLVYQVYRLNSNDSEAFSQFLFLELVNSGTYGIRGYHHEIKRHISLLKNLIDIEIELPQLYFSLSKLQLLHQEDTESLNSFLGGLLIILKKLDAIRLDEKRSNSGYIQRCIQSVKMEYASFQIIGLIETTKEEVKTIGDMIHLVLSRIDKDINLSIAEQTGNLAIIVGSADRFVEENSEKVKSLFETALKSFHGVVISGGTCNGIPGIVGEAAAELKKKTKKQFELIGYIPRQLDETVILCDTYDKQVKTDTNRFSFRQPLEYWRFIFEQGYRLGDVKLLGYDGGNISLFEYKLALLLGAQVGIVEGSGGTATELLLQNDWNTLPNLVVLPNDNAIVKMFLFKPEESIAVDTLEETARTIHENYRKKRCAEPADDSLLEWDELQESLKISNYEQAKNMLNIIRDHGFEVVNKAEQDCPRFELTAMELDELSMVEHGRWTIERLTRGWKKAPVKDIDKKHSPYLVPWDKLSEDVKSYDRDAVNGFLSILSEQGYSLKRK